MRRWQLVLALVVMASTTGAQPVELSEQKAHYLLRFLRYVEWPTRPGTGPFVICVVALNQFGAALQAAAKGQLVDGRPVAIQVVHAPSTDCHIVFVPDGMNVGAYIRAAHGTLTVGESPAFRSQGGAITFVVVDNQVRFTISAKAAARADVRISSRLLRLSYDDQPGAP